MICIKCKRDIPEGSVYCMYCGKQQTAVKKRRVRRANGNGGAWKRGSTYTAVWTAEKSDIADDGRIIQHRATKGGFKTRREAEDYAMQMSGMRKRPSEAPTLKEYWEQYSKTELPKLSQKKILGYKKAWERLAPIHGKRVDALFTRDMQRVIDNQKLTYWNVKDIKSVLQHLFDYAAGEGWASRDLPDLITLPEAEPEEVLPFSPEETTRIWQAYCDGNKDAGMILLMIYTGLMPGEIQRLSVKDVNFEEKTLSAGIGLKTKVRKQNSAILSDEAVAILRERCEGLKPDDPIFYKRQKTFYSRYYEALDAIPGVRRLAPYSCRHTTATVLAVKKLIPPEAVKRVMRWSSTAMLKVYAHADIEDARAAVEQINMRRSLTRDGGFECRQIVDSKSELSGIEENFQEKQKSP